MTNGNEIPDKIRKRINSGKNACYYSDQKPLSRLFPIAIYKTIITSVVLYECGTWSGTPREEHNLQMPENKLLRRVCGPRKDKVSSVGYYVTRNFVMYTDDLLSPG